MKKILFVYPSMILGGSTTALLSLMNSLDSKKYQIDLQLMSNSGPLFDYIPKHVNILSPADKYPSRLGKIIKRIRFVFQGAVIKAFLVNLKNKKIGFSSDIITSFSAKHLSKKNAKKYDFAIGFLEGWSDWYLAYNVNATKKYGWLHSTFANITTDPNSQLPWMKRVDKIVFVTEACASAFKKTLASMADKTIVIENITDSEIIKKRSELIDKNDESYVFFRSADCFKIVTVCRIDINTKGLDRIVNCAKKLKENNINFLWCIIGNGKDEEMLRSMIGEANVEDVLIPIGVRLNPYPFIKEADIMCMPSRYEGKPIVVTESMILGVPPVVTNYLSANDQIQNGVDGIVVENNDIAIMDAVFNCSCNKEYVQEMKFNITSNEDGNMKYVKKIESELLW